MDILKTNEYITKGEVMQIIHHAYAEKRISAKDGCASLLDDLNAVPAADVQPVIYAHGTINVGLRSYCSNCGKLAHLEAYCSKCGAKVETHNIHEIEASG